MSSIDVARYAVSWRHAKAGLAKLLMSFARFCAELVIGCGLAARQHVTR
jgi:hypothetical protein